MPNRPVVRLLMSLPQRLRQLQIPSNVTQESLAHLTLTDLNQEVVTFGQKYQGSTYEETWQDQEWIQFMASRYQSTAQRKLTAVSSGMSNSS